MPATWYEALRYVAPIRPGPLRLRQALKRTLRHPSLHRAVLNLGAARKRGLVLLVHRIAEHGPQPHEVVRSVPVELFRRQVALLAEVGDIVPADVLAQEPAGGRRPRFALTFDDDYPSQRQAAGILAELGVPGTFFLSGRCLHRLGPYWWEVLEAHIEEDGADRVADRLGLAPGTPQELAAACEGTVLADRLAAWGGDRPGSHLSADEIRAMSALPGITIGFHTVHHQVLPTLGPAALAEALALGRAELAALTGDPLDLLAYPNGKADDRVASAAAAAGYRFAWTGRIEPTTQASDPHLLGRWEPHDLPPDAFAAQLAVRLNLADAGP